MNEKIKDRIIALDILRAIAVFMICFYHWFSYKGTYIGVVVFFALSGYLFTKNQLSNRNMKDILKGSVRRIEKIYPSLLVVILFSTLGVYLVNDGLELKFKYSVLASIFGYNNIYQILSKISYFDNFGMLMPLTHIWALSFQLQMYILIPIVILVFKKMKFTNKTIGIIFVILSLVSASLMAFLYYKNADFSRIYYGTDTRIFSFLIAAAIGIFYSDRENIKITEKIIIKILGIMGIISIFIFSLMIDYKNPLNYYGLMFVVSVLISFTIVWLSKIEIEIFKNKMFLKLASPIIKLGQHQYQYYLWQYPLMLFFREIFKWSNINFYQQFAIQLVILIVISELSYYIFEKNRKSIKFKENMMVFNFLAIGLIFGITFAAPIYENIDLQEMKAIQNEKPVLEKATENTPVEQPQNAEKNSINENDQDNILSSLPDDNREILFVGDSVLEMARHDLKNKYPNSIIETKVGRQFFEFPKLLKMYIQQNKLKKIIVIALGTNGTIYKKDIEQVLDLLKDKEVYMINTVVPDPWEKSVNEEIKKASLENSNVKVIDWHSYSKGNKEFFYKDGTHPKPHAAKKYVHLIYSAVSKNISN